MSSVQTKVVSEAEGGQRLDRWLKNHLPGLAHGRLHKLLRTGQVRVDGRRAKPDQRLDAGQSVRLPPIDTSSASPRPARLGEGAPSASDVAALRARVLYKDEALIAIDKPAGLAVQGGTGQTRHLDGLLEALQFDAPERPRLVHRLDKDTSGVLLLGRSAAAARALTGAFRDKTTHKLYWAVVAGVPREAWGEIDTALIKRATPKGERIAVDDEDGKSAVTLYHRTAVFKKLASWMILAPLTGRTHQLRVHCAALGHPILGDGKYGGRRAFLADSPYAESIARRLHLHAREIAVTHPIDGTTLRVVAPLPDDMVKTFEAFGFAGVDPRSKEDRLIDRLRERTT